MTEYASSLLRLLSERGYVHQMTDAAALDALAARQVVPGYIGFDPTAPSLHVGSMVQIMLLRRLQQAGHKPIVVMGGPVADPRGLFARIRTVLDAGVRGVALGRNVWGAREPVAMVAALRALVHDGAAPEAAWARLHGEG